MDKNNTAYKKRVSSFVTLSPIFVLRQKLHIYPERYLKYAQKQKGG